jgi:hypothetical protein
LNQRLFGELKYGGGLIKRRISTLREGDWIFSPDQDGTLQRVRIRDKYISLSTELVRMDLERDSIPIFCTPNHPFRTPDGSFKPISKLKPGNLVTTRASDGTRTGCQVRKISQYNKKLFVYNLHVPPHYTYIAADCEVHNFKPADPFEP